ncbi:cyclin-dependent kinase 2-interacting protein-like isoform X2 [Crassostrea virginica]
MSHKNDAVNNLSKLFSPVRITSSPKYSSKTANLTGNERQIKDGCADIYNAIQKWTKTNREGTETITDMANIRISLLLESGEENVEKPDSSSELQKLESLCEELATCVQKLKKLVLKMKTVESKFHGVNNLSQYRNDSDVVFQTWSAKDFASAAEEITAMYQKEWKLKHSIYENICHAISRDSVMFYTSAWVHQPYIQERAELLLQSMLNETGHVS